MTRVGPRAEGNEATLVADEPMSPTTGTTSAAHRGWARVGSNHRPRDYESCKVGACRWRMIRAGSVVPQVRRSRRPHSLAPTETGVGGIGHALVTNL